MTKQGLVERDAFPPAGEVSQRPLRDLFERYR